LTAPHKDNFNIEDAVNGSIEDFDVTINNKKYDLRVSKSGAKATLAHSMKSAGVESNSVVKYQDGLYYYTTDAYNDLLAGPKAFKLAEKFDYSKVKSLTGWKAYATGGLADFTGPAWLDGTKSHPELVLNSRDTENFI
jgi:hypothetical protein